MNDPTVPGAGNSFVSILATIWGVEEAKEFLRQLVKQDLAITRDLRQQVEWVLRENTKLASEQREQRSVIYRDRRSYLSIIMTEGGMVNGMTYGLEL